MIRSDHRYASDCSLDSLTSRFSSLELLGDASSSGLSSGCQVEMRLGVKRKNESLESIKRKRRRSDLQSDSLVDALTSAFSCMYISTPPAGCGETPMKESSKDEKQSGLSLHNSSEVKYMPGKDEEQSGLSHPNNSMFGFGVSAVKSSRNYDEQSGLSFLNNNEVKPVPGKDKRQSGLSHLNNSNFKSGVSAVKSSRND